MKNEDTICWKISRAIEDLKELINNGRMDIGKYSERLHQMRKDAQRMENALKARKKLMIESGIEEEYQIRKAKDKQHSGINKIADLHEDRVERPYDLEITIKEKGEVVYQRESHGGVFSIVEEISDVSAYGEISGQSQQVFFGHPLVLFYGFDQLRQAMEGKQTEVLAAMKTAILGRRFADPETKKKILEAANKNL